MGSEPSTELPGDLTPLNLYAYLSSVMGMCGCSETEEMIMELIRVLQWHRGDMENRASYVDIYTNRGTFYIVAGRLNQLRLAGHGSAIRYPWLTDAGMRLLEALESIPAKEIDEAKGEAYNGLYYGL